MRSNTLIIFFNIIKVESFMKYSSYLKKISLFLSFFILQIAYSQSTQDIVNTLTNNDMIQLTTKTVTSTPTPWGTLKPGTKGQDDAWSFSTQKNNQVLSAVFVNDQKNWFLNDLNIMLFPGAKACNKTYKELATQFEKKLGRPNAQEKNNDDAGTFWQLKSNKEWGIWVSIVMGQNPKTHLDECAVKATLAFGADEYLSEDNDF